MKKKKTKETDKEEFKAIYDSGNFWLVIIQKLHSSRPNQDNLYRFYAYLI